MLENYKFKYRKKSKFIFVPNEPCERRGQRLLQFFKGVEFPDYFYHYKSGGHVAALHSHLPQKYFFRIDLQNFFYSIARERVFRVLRHWHFRPGGNYARWSCVRNPYPQGPRYVLPIGFLQSPLLASLVLMRSPVTEAIQSAQQHGVSISVYFDDFIGSHSDPSVLQQQYEALLHSFDQAKLFPNPAKLTPPSEAIVAFNCNLTMGRAEVSQDRIAKFFEFVPSAASQKAFFEYRQRVASKNS